LCFLHCLTHNLGIKKPGTNSKLSRGTKTSRAGAASPHERSDRRLGLIVRLLTEHAMVVMSGTKLAEEISSTRSEVWRLIQQLRGMGVDVAGHPATGYQLRSMPDLLLPEILSPLLRGTIFADNIHHLYKVESTNTAAQQAAAEGAPEGSVYLAEEQTAGRGRGTNSWDSQRSAGIYGSVILRPALPPSEILVLTLATALAVHAAVREIDSGLSSSIDLKWPNDILIGGKKVCGILTEMNSEPMRVRYIVAGIGINVNQTGFPPELETLATSLRLASGSEWSRVELTAALLKSLYREYSQLISQADARASILRRFAEHSSWVQGKEVRIEETFSPLHGITAGLDQRGFLLLQTASGMQTVLSGTVRGA
jgi:BirA family biotin operon repressor/biotin-[acetyl-CoA-carboxylase] ligase